MLLLPFFVFLLYVLKVANFSNTSSLQQNAKSEMDSDSVTNTHVMPVGKDSHFTRRNATHNTVTDTHTKQTQQRRAKRHQRKNKIKNRRVPRAATARIERLWSDGVIPYYFDETFVGNTALIKQAMRQWENSTCIKFVEREIIEHPDYILFTEKNCGCCSFFVGRKGTGSQEMSISKRCQMGNILHELGHAIGFWHEHSRPDRDQHVKILNNNIIRGWEGNFLKLNDTEINTWNLPYDFTSIMHYGRKGFSRSQYLDTIVPIDSEGEKEFDIGQRSQLSDYDIEQTNLLYKCPKCGQTFQERSGKFSFSSSNKISESEQHCEWRIIATNGERIILNITDFNLEEDCSLSYIEVRDGYWHKSPLLGTICSIGKSQSFVSNSSRLLITYVSKSPQLTQRFSGQYQIMCGGEIFLDSEMYIESPNYPENYRPNTECVWKISVPKDFQVALKFRSFEIEKHDQCLFDYVEVRDGFSKESIILGLYCGYSLPSDLISTSHHLLLRFVSDGSRERAGFSISVFQEFDECAKTDHRCGHKCINTFGSYKCVCDKGFELQEDGKKCKDTCGGLLETSNGTIMSPSFPNSYSLNQTCIWEIVAKSQHRIILNFTHLDLEGDDGDNIYTHICDYDRVEIHSQISEENIKTSTLCGSKLPSPVLSEGNVITVTFISDDTFTKTGFSAFFTTQIDECADNNGGCQYRCVKTIGSYHCVCPNGFTLHTNGRTCLRGDCYVEITDAFGVLKSPNYPELYPKLQNCVWKFHTTPGHRVRVAFLFFEVEYHQECLYDYVEVHNGPSLESSIMGKFCGSKLPPEMVSATNELYIYFKSNMVVQRRGFWATHTSVCGGMLMATPEKQYIYSHSTFGNHKYYNKASCEWSIAVRFDYSIKLRFLNFKLEDSKDCESDFVEIFGGVNHNAIYYGRFCGSNKIPDIISSEEGFRILFQSDDSFGTDGFKIEYVAVEDFLQ